MKHRLSIEEALEKVGSEGRYQKLMFAYFTICWGWQSSVFTLTAFLFLVPQFVNIDNQIVSEQHGCASRLATDNVMSITLAYQLYCDSDRIHFRNVGQFMSTAGSVIGSFLNFFSFSRKYSYVVGMFISVIGALLFLFCQQLEFIYAGLFLAGFGANQACIIQVSILSEQFGHRLRNIASVAVQLGWSVGTILLTFVAQHCKDWKLFLIYTYCIPCFILCLPLLILQDSPSYVYLNSKSKSIQILNNIAYYNNNSPLQEEQLKDPVYKTKQNYFVSDLFRYKSVRIHIISTSMMYFTIQACQFASILNQQYFIQLSLYNQIILSAFLESVANAFCTYYSEKLERKKTLFITNVLIFILYLSCAQFDTQYYEMTVNLVNRFFIQVSCNFLVLYVEEIFPVSIKNIAVGFYYGFGLSGGIISPYIVHFSQSLNIKFSLMLALLSLISVMITFTIKESLHQPIQTEIEELRNDKKEYLIQQVQLN